MKRQMNWLLTYLSKEFEIQMAWSLAVTLLHTRWLVVSNKVPEEEKALAMVVYFHDVVLVHFGQLKTKEKKGNDR